MVTIAIPLYNSEKYIERSLESALSQTFQDIEILLINDCSTDNSLAIVEAIMKSNDTSIKIRIVNQETNQGVGMARNRAISEALGEYLYFLDSDDIITPNCIGLLYETIISKKCNFVVSSYGCCYENEYPRINSVVSEYAIINTNDDFFKYKYSYTKKSLFTIYIWNILFDLNFIKSNNLFFKNYKKGEDHIFFLEMMPFINSCIILSDITYYYILKEQSLSYYGIRDYISSEEVDNNVQVLRDELLIIKKWSDNYYFPEIIFHQIRSAYWMLLSIMRKEKIIKPYISEETIKFLCSNHLSLNEILSFKRKRIIHLAFFLFAKLPLFCQKEIIRSYLKIMNK
jgi:glycosyltransferase involved in cell wall biosynthesis